MKLRKQVEGLAIDLLFAAVLVKDTLVKITATNLTVDKSGANDFVIGRVTVPAKAIGGTGTVELSGRFKEHIEIKTTAAITAGDWVKMTAADGTTGENTIGVWVEGTDALKRLIGVAIKGAGSGGVAEILTF